MAAPDNLFVSGQPIFLYRHVFGFWLNHMPAIGTRLAVRHDFTVFSTGL